MDTLAGVAQTGYITVRVRVSSGFINVRAAVLSTTEHNSWGGGDAEDRGRAMLGFEVGCDSDFYNGIRLRHSSDLGLGADLK